MYSNACYHEKFETDHEGDRAIRILYVDRVELYIGISF